MIPETILKSLLQQSDVLWFVLGNKHLVYASLPALCDPVAEEAVTSVFMIYILVSM